MDLIKTIDALIKSAKDGGKTFKSMDASDKLISTIESNAKLRFDSYPSQQGVIRAHSEWTIMMLLDEVNRQEREIRVLEKTIENYKEAINSIA